MKVEDTRNGWEQETGDLQRRLRDAEGKLQDLRDDFGAFREATQSKDVVLEGRIATFENELQVKDSSTPTCLREVSILNPQHALW